MNETNQINKEDKVKELFESGAHFAFSKSRRHPSVKSFIFGAKNNVEIFDLEQTVDLLNKAKDFIRQLASDRKTLLFVGGKNEARTIIEKNVSKISQPYVASRWIGGTLTNFPEIRKRVDRMESLIDQKEKGELSKYTKKERLLIDREIESLEKMFGGLRDLKSLPHALFVVDSKKEGIAVKEAKDKNIPVISLSGSDCDLNLIDFPIPGNDTSISSIEYFVNQIISAFKEGQDLSQDRKAESKK